MSVRDELEKYAEIWRETPIMVTLIGAAVVGLVVAMIWAVFAP